MSVSSSFSTTVIQKSSAEIIAIYTSDLHLGRNRAKAMEHLYTVGTSMKPFEDAGTEEQLAKYEEDFTCHFRCFERSLRLSEDTEPRSSSPSSSRRLLSRSRKRSKQWARRARTTCSARLSRRCQRARRRCDEWTIASSKSLKETTAGDAKKEGPIRQIQNSKNFLFFVHLLLVFSILRDFSRILIDSCNIKFLLSFLLFLSIVW